MPIDTLDCTVPDVWLSCTGCGSHGPGHTKEDVGKVGWSADSQFNYATSAASAVSAVSVHSQ